MPVDWVSYGMPLAAFETFVTPATLLWLVVSGFAAMLLFSSLHRRRGSLTTALRDFVQQHQDRHQPPDAPPTKARKTDPPADD